MVTGAPPRASDQSQAALPPPPAKPPTLSESAASVSSLRTTEEYGRSARKVKVSLFQVFYIQRANEYLPYHSTSTLLRISTTTRAHFGDVSEIVNSSILFVFFRLSEVARLFRRASRNRRPQYSCIHISVTNRSCAPVTTNAGKLQISPHFTPTNQYSRGIAFNMKPSREQKVA